ncbi:MAG: hypothetical protein K6E85_16890 [Lachnospiraceae bacterium]|nr:hypothetical protein [Lachnospiraceae bacterium]
MLKKNKSNENQKPVEEMSYAERLRRQEDDDRYMAEQRMQSGPKTGCLGMSASFLVGFFCVVFLIVGLGFAGCGIAGVIGTGKTRVYQTIIGLAVSAVSVIVWIFFRKNYNNDR